MSADPNTSEQPDEGRLRPAEPGAQPSPEEVSTREADVANGERPDA